MDYSISKTTSWTILLSIIVISINYIFIFIGKYFAYEIFSTPYQSKIFTILLITANISLYLEFKKCFQYFNLKALANMTLISSCFSAIQLALPLILTDSVIILLTVDIISFVINIVCLIMILSLKNEDNHQSIALLKLYSKSIFAVLGLAILLGLTILIPGMFRISSFSYLIAIYPNYILFKFAMKLRSETEV